jgi:hypothetical protein
VNQASVRSGLRLAVAALTVSFAVSVAIIHGASAGQVRTPARCRDTQLSVAAESWFGAGDNDGFIVLVANHSSRTCSIEGYARISFVSSLGDGIRAKVLHKGSMLFATVPPHPVLLTSNSDASFAVSFDGAFIPSNDSPSKCLAESMSVDLPTIHPRFYSAGDLVVPVHIDLCTSDWTVSLTPIESGAQVRSSA